MATKKYTRRFKIRKSIRKKIQGTADRPRLSIYRSNKEIYAQIIDDVSGKTLVQVSSMKMGLEGTPKAEASKKVGESVAKACKESGIEKVVFDRGGYLYHGRVKALADGAREGGLQF